MKRKIVGIFIMILLIGTTIPVIRTISNEIVIKQNYDNETDNLGYQTSLNGVILDQVLDENNKGYSVISVWGTHYEMGYAQAELLGDYIVQAVKENIDFAGNDYNQIRELMSEAVWIPQVIEDEFDGMVDSLAITHPLENIDDLDLKALNTLGDWSYGFACRSHSCWGRYVSEPIKTLSTRRLDFQSPYSSANHIVLCARDPDDGSGKWLNLAFPGYLLVATCVNEYGTLVSSHDYNSYDTDFSQDCMPRMVAYRYAATYTPNSDISTHLTDVYNELQNYEMMVGGFLNYYTPEGYGGVMTFNPLQTGADFYDLRISQENWHHGEAIITTNQWTDGTYTPSDEDFGADSYYNDESPKTLDTHWDLLHYEGVGGRGMHQLSLAYRGAEDMTIWADGKISSSQNTPRLEYEWSDLFFEPPIMNEIDGLTSGKAGDEHEYIFSATDPDGDDVTYVIDWGDDTGEEEFGPYPSGEEQTFSHTWSEKDTYTIRSMAKDIHGAESDWIELEVSMSKTKITVSPFITFLENHPHLFTLIRLIFGLK